MYQLYCTILLIVHAYVLYYMYTKAEHYGMSGLLWVLAGFFFPVISLVVFLLVIRNMELAHRERNKSDVGENILFPRGKSSIIPPAVSKSVEADEDFRAPELDKLIDERNFIGARKYLLRMLKVSQDMGDRTAIADYLQYEDKIAEAERKERDWLNMNP